jgi:arylsulfatase A-like enzyme/Flp pilus assembly protein TadD
MERCDLGRTLLAVGSVIALTALLVLLIAGGCAKRRPLNILLITFDTTRADHIGCYEGQPAHTPTLDSLAAAGIRFTQAVTPVPLTLPAHASVLTGLNPTRHGIRDNGAFHLDPSLPVLADQLRKNGYQTGAFVSAFVLARQFGLDRGFDTYDDALFNERSGFRTNRAALRWADHLDVARPFFLWVHYFEPHAPYHPSARFRALPGLSPYAQEVAAADAAAGELLGALRARGLLKNTAIVCVGDHGEGLGAHGEDEHGIFLYDEAVRVPFLLDLPKGPDQKVIATPVSLIDIAPTLLDATGLPALAGAEGVSLRPLIEGAAFTPRPAEYCETFCPEFNYDHSALQALRTPRWKYIRAPEPELYDLAQDPDERCNLYAEQPDTARAFAKRLDRYTASAAAPSSRAMALSGEDLERLQSLGYVSGGKASQPSGRARPDPKAMIPVLRDFAAAKEALYAERLPEAVAGFRKVLERSPENVVAALNLGKCLTRLHRPDEAVEVLLRAWGLAPENTTLAADLGEAYRLAGRPAEALEPFRVAMRDPLHQWDGTLGTVRCLLATGRLDDARKTLAGAVGGSEAQIRELAGKVDRYVQLRSRLEVEPGNERLKLDLAGAAFDLGLCDEIRAILRFRSSDGAIEGMRHRILGSVAGTEGNATEALVEFEQAAAGLPGDPQVIRHLAAFYLAAGRPKDALAAIDKALSLGPPDASLFYNQACAYARLGETDAALRTLEQAIRLGFDRGSKILEDPDLAALQDDPRLLELAEMASRR